MLGKYPILKIFFSLDPPTLIPPLLLLLLLVVVVFCENPCLAEMGAIRTTIIITAAKVLVNFVSSKFNMSVDKICRWLNIIALKDATFEYSMQGLFQYFLLRRISLSSKETTGRIMHSDGLTLGRTNMRFLAYTKSSHTIKEAVNA